MVLANDGNIIINGKFDNNVDGWGTYTGDGSNAKVSSENGELKVDFPNYDGWFIWSTQVYQDKIKLEAGKAYVLKFDARSTNPKNATVEITKGTSGSHLPQQPVSLTTEVKTFSYEVTVPGETDINAKLNFLLGSNNVPGEQFVAHSIFIDNVTLTEK
jgi:hypothetical protein